MSTSFSHPIAPSVSRPSSWLVWNLEKENWSRVSASFILNQFEKGELNENTLIKVTHTSQEKPLKQHIRELVWSAHQEERNQIPSIKESHSTPLEIVKQAPIPTALSDLAGRITYVNQAFCDFIEYTEEQLIGLNVGALSHDEDHQKESQNGNRLLAGQLKGFQMSKRYITQSGDVKEGLVGIVILTNDQGVPESAMAQIIDLTPFKEMQEQIAKNKTLAAIGRMAQEITHDLKNILMTLQGTLDLLRLYQSSFDSEEQMLIDDGLQICRNGYRLIQNLLSFNPQHPFSEEPLNLIELIHDLMPSLDASLTPCPLRFQCIQEELWVNGDLNRFQSIILNLVLNAKQAIQTQMINDAQEITNKEAYQSHLISIILTSTEDEVILSIQDTGCGMSPEIRKQVMQPYFTTKSDQGGTGIGLASVWKTCEYFQIKIEVESRVYQGTCFTLSFPKLVDPYKNYSLF